MPAKHEDDARLDALSVCRPPRDPYRGVMPWDRWRRRWKMVAKFYRWQIWLLQEENRRRDQAPIVTPSCPHCEALMRENERLRDLLAEAPRADAFSDKLPLSKPLPADPLYP